MQLRTASLIAGIVCFFI